MKKNLYQYRGGVLHFDTLVARDWRSQTYAVSEKQAAINLAFQFKKAMGMSVNTVVKLTGIPVLAQEPYAQGGAVS